MMVGEDFAIQGERVIFRRTTEKDIADVMHLWNDGRVMRFVGFPEGLGYDSARMRSWFKQLQADPDRHHFVVRATESGFCGEVYYTVDREHMRASLDIKFLPEAQGKGLAADTLEVLIGLIFESEADVEAVSRTLFHDILRRVRSLLLTAMPSRAG